MSLFNLNYLPPFQYTPIDPSQRVFRVVRLLPPRPSLLPCAYGTLRVEIIEVNVDLNTSYDALSYAWNAPSKTTAPNRQIIVETKDGPRGLYIYRSLELALFHLVPDSTAHHQPLFIDQISINQENNSEKSHQVQLMRDIYTRCNRTVVWLGLPTHGSNQYFRYVHKICHEGVLSRVIGPRLGHFMHVFDAVMDPSIEVSGEEREDRDDLLHMIRRFGDTFPLDGFADVLDRRWFNRLWVIQEACLAPVVIFVCGYQSLCFDCFRSGALFYNLYNTHWVRQLVGAMGQHELRRRNAIFDKTAGLIRIFQERKAIHQNGKRRGLYDLVLKYNINHDSKKIGASLDEDRIFGLLGLTADDDRLRQRIHIRYKKEVIQVYTEVTPLLLEENIDALLFVQFPKQTTGGLPSDTRKLPSWVPDWAMDLTIPVGYSDLTEPIFSAGGPKEGAHFRFDERSSQLIIRGVLIDKVVRVGNRTHRADPKPQIMEQIDYRRAKAFFDEVSDIVREARATVNGRGPSAQNEEMYAQICLRLCDSGLSYKYFTEKLGVSPGVERLRALHDTISHLGQRLLNSDEAIAAYHITRIYRTVGITPWYWTPASEMESLRLCALDPVAAGKIVCDALLDFVTDMVGLCVASARISFAKFYIKFRHRFGKVNLKPTREAVERVGLDPEVVFGSDMDAFTSNLLKNRDRKLYRTETGYVGIGPALMTPGDAIVVFHGGTVPHVIRETEDLGMGNKVYEYLGEAYCDGIMNGEALEPGAGVEESFVLA